LQSGEQPKALTGLGVLPRREEFPTEVEPSLRARLGSHRADPTSRRCVARPASGGPVRRRSQTSRAGDDSTRRRGRRSLRSPRPATSRGCWRTPRARHSPRLVASTVISSRTPPVAVSRTAAEWVWTWVSTPMTTSTTSRRSVRLFMRSLLRGTGRGSGPGRRLGRTVMRHARRGERQVVKLLIRPAPPTGPGPATASGHVAARHKASHSGGHTRGHQPTAQHHQAAKAILTVTPPPLTRCREIAKSGRPGGARVPTSPG
jgi:hypothetical protein